jgi:hypothetical protein
MDCGQTKQLLYEFIIGQLDKETQGQVEDHLKVCQQCSLGAKEMKSTLGLIKEAEPPPPSPHFQEKLLTKLSQIPLPPKPFLLRLGERLRIPSLDSFYMRRSYKWVAVAACMLLTLTVVRSFIEENSHDAVQRGFQITLTEVKNPIIVETENVGAARGGLETLVQAHNGKIVQIIQEDKKLKVILSLEKGEESSFFSELQQIGKTKREKEGYKDKKGNIVVILSEVDS